MARKQNMDCVVQPNCRCNKCGECGFIGEMDSDGEVVAQAEDASRCIHGVREDRLCPECRDRYSQRYLNG